MTWEVEYKDEFERWWRTLNEAEQDSVAVSVVLLEQKGPALPFPHSSGITQSKHSHMRELRIQHQGNPYRILYAFDARRAAILLLVHKGVRKRYIGESGKASQKRREGTNIRQCPS